MIRGLYTAASGMLLGLRQQDVIASNLSNTNTVGYKHDQFAPSAFGNVLARRVGEASGPVPGMNQHAIGVFGTGAYVDQVRTQLTLSLGNSARGMVPSGVVDRGQPPM